MDGKEQNATARSEADDLNLIEQVQRIKREVFQEKQALVNWRQVSIELRRLRERIISSEVLSSKKRNEWLTWIGTWQGYAKAGSLFQAEPLAKEMLLELERLDVEIFLATERKIDWAIVWEHRGRIDSLLHRLPPTSKRLKELGYHHFDELVKKLKLIHAARGEEGKTTSAAISARISASLSDARAQGIVPRREEIVRIQKPITQLMNASIDRRRSAELYKELSLAQAGSRKALVEGSKDLRRLWQGLAACKPILLHDHRESNFAMLAQLQKNLHAAWNLWLSGWTRLRDARVKSFKIVGATAIARLGVKLDYLVAKLEHKRGHILELESKYEWSEDDGAKEHVAHRLQRDAVQARRLKQEIRATRNELERLERSNSTSDDQL
jgi:hypothetical protein